MKWFHSTKIQEVLQMTLHETKRATFPSPVKDEVGNSIQKDNDEIRKIIFGGRLQMALSVAHNRVFFRCLPFSLCICVSSHYISSSLTIIPITPMHIVLTYASRNWLCLFNITGIGLELACTRLVLIYFCPPIS